MAEGDEQLAAPSKEQLEQEKQLLLAFKPVMQKFLHDHTELQVSALYALQVHCNANTFPKGMGPRKVLDGESCTVYMSANKSPKTALQNVRVRSG